MLEKKFVYAYPIETVKTQIERKCKNVKCYDGIHDKTWTKYPCFTMEICRNDHCDGRIRFAISTPTRDIKVITVFNIKSEQRSYAHIDQQLRSLITKGFLKNLTPEKKELSQPIFQTPSLYIENPPLPSGSKIKHKKK